MRKTITITDPRQVKAGDEAYFKDCDFGFCVVGMDTEDKGRPIAVSNPLSGASYWACSSRFDHATREVEEPEWPAPSDSEMHIYLGADGRRYIYNPIDDDGAMPWFIENHCVYHSREHMEAYHRDALPLTEVRLVPAKDDDDER